MDGLKKSASNGHVPAVQSLEDLVQRGKLSIQEVYPTIDPLITLEHAGRIEADDWITTPHAANLISCFGMLAVFFSGQFLDAVTTSNLDALLMIPELWFYVQEWVLLFMERTRILDFDATPRDLELVELIERVLIAISPIIRPRLSFVSTDFPRTTIFFRRLVHFWIRCNACPNVLAPNIIDFISIAAYPDGPMDHREALRNTITFLPPNEVASTLVSAYAKLLAEPVLNANHAKILVMFTSFSFGHHHCAYELRTSRISYWSARLFRRLTSLRAHQDVRQPRTRLMEVAWETLDNLDALSVLGYMWVKDVLRADSLHALLNIQVLVHRSGDRALRQAALDVKIARMLVKIRPFLIWPSIRALVRKSLRCIRSSGISEGLDLPYSQASRGFIAIRDATVSLSEAYTVKKKILSFCANPECWDPANLRREKFRRCLGCRPSHCVYCSYSCQKEHWKNGHDEYEDLLCLGSRTTIVRFRLGSACDEEWIQYQAHHDLTLHRKAIAALSTQGNDIPVLIMDYRSFVEKLKVDLSMISFNDFPKLFPSILYESWYEKMNPRRVVNDHIVIILAPFTPEMPYSLATTVNWLNNLNYPRPVGT